MSTAGPAAEGSPSVRPRFEPTQEVRFAVVLYGGVSLAIYIHGVVQELLRMVRATAPERSRRPPLPKDPHDPEKTGAKGWSNDELFSQEELRGSEKVYRKLGQLLAAGCATSAGEPLPGAPVRTRFLVDVISGTSAGGINGIFLAKALAGCLPMDALKDLWVREGDIATLLNDKASYEALRLPPPQGCCCSQLAGARVL